MLTTFILNVPKFLFLDIYLIFKNVYKNVRNVYTCEKCPEKHFIKRVPKSYSNDILI